MKESSIEIDEIIREILYGLYHDGVFTKDILIKGGQAVRIKEDIKHRFSVDIDASVNGAIPDPSTFFVLFKRSLDKQFIKSNLVVIDFKQVRKPRNPHLDTPAFWTGWLVTFKLLEKENQKPDKEKQSRMAIIPDGSASPKITVELSEHEYCGDFKQMKLEIKNEPEKVSTYWYSTEMLVVEKIRAICQQHPDYPHRRKPTSRARDFYDIANLIEKKIKDKDLSNFKNKCANLIDPIFKAKQVDKKIIKKIFEPKFVAKMKEGWPLVLETTPNRGKHEFEIYVDILEEFVNSIT